MADPVVHITAGIPDSGTGNITTLGAIVALLPTALGTGGGLKVDGSGTALPVSGSVTVSGTATVSGSVTANAGTNLNTSALALEAGGNLASLVTQIGAVTVSPTANTVQDRLKTINSTLASPFQAGGSIGNTTFASTQSGTWTVQPGNTPNTSPWLVTINDGTSSAAVKGSSTAAVATDKSLVVALSPNVFGNTTMANSVPVTLASNQSSVPVAATQSGAWTVQPGNTSNTTPWLVVVGDGTNSAAIKAASTAAVAADKSLVVALSPNVFGQAVMASSVPVTIASNQSALPVSQSGTWTVQPGNTPNSSPWLMQSVPATSGGLSISSAIMAATTNATSVKGSAGQLYKVEVFNNSANIGYLKFYNSSSAPTAGVGTPVLRLGIPGNSSGVALLSSYEVGDAFSSGIGYTFVGGIADNDATAVAANAFIVNVHYK